VKISGSKSLPPRGPNTFLVRWGTFLAGSIIVLAALAVYHNSFSGPLILDDPSAITVNLSIRHLASALFPPPAATTGGRPLLNLTFAINYALGGMNVWGYHAFNLAIHIFAGLTLFGVVRRTLLCRELSECGRGVLTSRLPARKSQISDLKSEMLEPTWLALTVAVLWVVHPLQTESVAYISQRAESLMGLFYLLTLYCFIRGTERSCQVSSSFAKATEDRGVRYQVSEDPKTGSQLSTLSSQRLASAFQLFSPSAFWLPASVTACFLGALCKEVIATAPVIVFLYDRTFIAGSFRDAWRLRWRYYLGLGGTWLPLAFSMVSLHQRGVGFHQNVTWWSYALTSCRSVVLYLKLAVWPHPLVFDYGTDIIRNVAGALPYILVLVFLVAGLGFALWRRPAMGFVGAWFFVILAVTSSVVPVAQQPMAENRMYLSLAAIIVLVVLGLYSLIGRRSLILFAAMAVGLGWLGVRRNEDYRSALSIWSDTVAKRPDNARAHNHLGLALVAIPGRLTDAMAEFQTTLRIRPDAEAHYNLGRTLLQIPGHAPDAMAEFEAALRLKPDYAEAHCNLGVLLRQKGNLPAAMAEYNAALRIKPDYAEAYNNLGCALLQIPERWPDAIAAYQAALRINPDYAEAHYNLGYAFSQIPSRWPDAIAQYEATLRIRPDLIQARQALDRLQASQ
jgi:tetratricopeptide (TPR) repeat protein